LGIFCWNADDASIGLLALLLAEELIEGLSLPPEPGLPEAADADWPDAPDTAALYMADMDDRLYELRYLSASIWYFMAASIDGITCNHKNAH